ncbi:hypothetical protein BOX15_Mlig007717g2 [Macrostomum lignano]|uniref:DEP domain-containing protein n=1 Tax=Macrostomum lignano TaxID=282301 RepID=A0A267DH50_9PLAT|nr:hypothetical protein BOX15_Mlig007717g2 [Macrostomum lignano]
MPSRYKSLAISNFTKCFKIFLKMFTIGQTDFEDSCDASSEAPSSGLRSQQQFRATRQWKQLLGCLFPSIQTDLKRSGKQLHTAAIEYLQLTSSEASASVSQTDSHSRAQSVCQGLLDSGTLLSCGGSSNSTKFEAKSNRFYRLNTSSPSVQPFVEVGSTAEADSGQKFDMQHKNYASGLRLKQVKLLRRLLTGGGQAVRGLLRGAPSRLSSRLQHVRSASCLAGTGRGLELELDEQLDEEHVVDEEEQVVSGAAKVDIESVDSSQHNQYRGDDSPVEKRRKDGGGGFAEISRPKGFIEQTDGRGDASISALEITLRDELYTCHDPSNATSYLDECIHHLCLQRLLRLIDLPVIDELAHMEEPQSDSATKPASPRRGSRCATSSFLDLQQHASIPPQQQRRCQSLMFPTVSIPSTSSSMPKFREFLASQLAHDLQATGGGRNSPSRHPLTLQRLINLLGRLPDPLGWSKLRHVFAALLVQPSPPPLSTSEESEFFCRVLQMAFCLLSLRHRQLSENLLAYVECCCHQDHQDQDQQQQHLLNQLAELLLADSRHGWAWQQLRHENADRSAAASSSIRQWRQRVRCLFSLALGNWRRLFRLPMDIYQRAKLLSRLRKRQQRLTLMPKQAQSQEQPGNLLRTEETQRTSRITTEAALVDLMQRLLEEAGSNEQARQDRLNQFRVHHPDLFRKHFAVD